MIRRTHDTGSEREERPGQQSQQTSTSPAGERPPPAGAAAEDAPAFRARMPSFSGPLDLLLYLIHKEEIDIFDIPIAYILDQYVAYLKHLEQNGLLDLLEAGEFMVMASRLMEIKSRMLLPDLATEADEGIIEEEIEDPRLSLVQQLLEYKEIKERALLLEHIHGEHARRYDRPPLEFPEQPETLDLSKASIWDLCAAFDRVLEDAERLAVRVIPYDDTPIEVIIERIQTRLKESDRGSLEFRALFSAEMVRPVLISHFLALLEMARLHLIWIAQEQETGGILITQRLLA